MPRTTKKKRALILSGGGARGAYQAGVFKYLQESGYKPDIVCGTSVGAINAIGIASGMSADKIIELWQNIESKKIMHISFWKYFRDLLRRRLSPVADPAPLRSLLMQHIDLAHLKEETAAKVFVSAVDICTAEVRFFSNAEITFDHLMASSAIPLVFPWQELDGKFYWDGGLMANTPILPAMQAGATELLVVLLSPAGGVSMDVPQNRTQALERVVELSLIGSYQNLRLRLEESEKGYRRLPNLFYTSKENIKVLSIGPEESLGIRSVMNFSSVQADQLIEKGYSEAQQQLEKQKWNL
ncbi:MAG: patatin-like phospholipase family protein [Spirochaetota bacterium]